ncbi:c-type cytochrome biogenesis protein CcsB [Frankia sp. CNm7]|uniref:C-type cytochrome biogenesis protein CcsB n=1 Tax=Frankia nepalensis TaxID=1836974 RepID=A0A937UR05_9ACTN|nr:c-type cytochrome biogenesis protein CcsB [Frankia nepalensis]MBL7496039.1 c-type cytochrome biogenesis protein CcsB [Frankia nepalensis]MBL7511840.1 c-type cytochrome biogenesis protein CcsB [Frankia nepalensis]MBL7517215.1 c-type cytochrome biogenesis protein CcsB [Frankia nepalensis]MBL7630643.1 c-type cytochrome biogenesis protein CcsB [Frankia nepalensis]
MAVDEGLAQLSDNLFNGGLAVYSAAMLAFAAEFAFNRFGRTATVDAAEREKATQATTVEKARQPALAGVGASGLATEAAPGAGTADVSTGTGSGSAAAPGTAAPGVASTGVASVRPAHGGLAGEAGEAPPGRARLIGRAAVGFTVVAWALHVGSVVTRGLAADRVPWGNMYEFSSMICLIAITAFLVLLTRYPVRWLGVFVTLPVLLSLGFAGTVLYTPAGPLVPALNSYWLKIHVAAAILSSGIFLVSAVTTVLYLVRDRWEQRLAEVAAGRAEVSGAMRNRGGIVTKLPSSGALDTLTYRLIAFGFPIWTFAVIAGAIWAEAAWGRYWGWDPKETWSFITWVGYAAYLHARATAGWRGRKAAVVSLVAFSALFVDYYLVNLVVSGLHSYAGV